MNEPTNPESSVFSFWTARIKASSPEGLFVVIKSKWTTRKGCHFSTCNKSSIRICLEWLRYWMGLWLDSGNMLWDMAHFALDQTEISITYGDRKVLLSYTIKVLPVATWIPELNLELMASDFPTTEGSNDHLAGSVQVIKMEIIFWICIMAVDSPADLQSLIAEAHI